ncbi:MAG: hypothetical protein ACRDO8_12725 [Nocardioidaceae bacterium]
MSNPPGDEDPYRRHPEEHGQHPDEWPDQHGQPGQESPPPGYGPPQGYPPPPGYPPPQGYGPPPGYAPPYGYGYPPQPRHSGAMTALVLGIVGLVVCQIASPFAWWYGKKTMDEIQAQPGRYSGYSEAKAGWICGIIGTALLALAVLLLVVLLIIGVALGTSTEFSST